MQSHKILKGKSYGYFVFVSHCPTFVIYIFLLCIVNFGDLDVGTRNRGYLKLMNMKSRIEITS